MELYNYGDRSITPFLPKYALHKTRDFNYNYMGDPRVMAKYASDAEKKVKKIKNKMVRSGTGFDDLKDLAVAKIDAKAAKSAAVNSANIMGGNFSDADSEGKETAGKALAAGLGVMGTMAAGKAANTYLTAKANKRAELEAGKDSNSTKSTPDSMKPVAPQGKATDASDSDSDSAADKLTGGALALGGVLAVKSGVDKIKKVGQYVDMFDKLI